MAEARDRGRLRRGRVGGEMRLIANPHGGDHGQTGGGQGELGARGAKPYRMGESRTARWRKWVHRQPGRTVEID